MRRAPSDVRRGVTGPLEIGGRVLDAKGDALVIADAFATLRVRLTTPAGVSPGDLVVLGVSAAGDALSGVVLEHVPCGTPAGPGEFSRLALRGVGPRLAARSRALAAIRAVFAADDFVEVETPVRVPSPGLDLHVDALSAHDGFLVTSPEFAMKRLLTGGVPRLYQLARCTRAGELGPWHEPEFTLLEWYRAFATMNDVMVDTERVVRAVAGELAEATVLTRDGRALAVDRPFDRVTVREAFRAHAGVADAVDLAGSDEARFFDLLVSHVEPALARHDRPVFLHEYPATQASLARRSPGDPSVAERFELYALGVELCNGFGELTSGEELDARWNADLAARRRLGRPLYPKDHRLLAALAEGMPPSAGNALGVDRLVALALGAPGVASVQAVPAERA